MEASMAIAQTHHKGTHFPPCSEGWEAFDVHLFWKKRTLGHFLIISDFLGIRLASYLAPADPKLSNMHMPEGKLGPHQETKSVSN